MQSAPPSSGSQVPGRETAFWLGLGELLLVQDVTCMAWAKSTVNMLCSSCCVSEIFSDIQPAFLLS